jgi:hypothetical protein
MAQIMETAAYVRNPHAQTRDDTWEGSDPLLPEVLNLLATPHTVDSLCRSLGERQTHAPASRSAVCSALSELVDRDLAELSPDT